MNFSQEQLTGIVRHFVTLAGAIILVFFSGAEGLITEVGASVVMLAGVIWSIAVKANQPLIDKIRGVINHSIAITSAFLIYFGKVDVNETLTGIVTSIMNLLPFLLSIFDKRQ